MPQSYRTNSTKEQLLLSYTDNFNRQFRKLYGDRKPQFLRPLNECGVEVSETVSNSVYYGLCVTFRFSEICMYNTAAYLPALQGVVRLGWLCFLRS